MTVMKMKTWAFCVACSVATAMAAPCDVEVLRAKIDDTKRYTEHYNGNVPYMLVNHIDNCHEPEFQALQRELATSWRCALEHLDELAPDDLTKTLVLCSCWFMDENEFGTFLLEVACLAEQGKITPETFRYCKAPFESPLQGYSTRHRKDPAMREVEKTFQVVLEREKMRKEAAATGVEPSPEATAVFAPQVPRPSSPAESAERKWLLPSVFAALAILEAGTIWFFHGKRRGS